MLRQGRDLGLPHPTGRRIAVGQQQRWAGAVNLVVDLDPVTIDCRHARFPKADVAKFRPALSSPVHILARSVWGWEMRKWGMHPRPARVIDRPEAASLPQRTRSNFRILII